MFSFADTIAVQFHENKRRFQLQKTTFLAIKKLITKLNTTLYSLPTSNDHFFPTTYCCRQLFTTDNKTLSNHNNGHTI